MKDVRWRESRGEVLTQSKDDSGCSVEYRPGGT